MCPSEKARSGGSSAAQISWANGQRVRKRQPDGGSTDEGSSPYDVALASTRAVGSATGIVSISALV